MAEPACRGKPACWLSWYRFAACGWKSIPCFIRDIAEVMGLKSLKAVKKLVESDPVSIRDVIKGVI
jgi:hypothetical protein